MFIDGPNPTKIQEAETAANQIRHPPPALILIHDGGGTTFSYHMLGKLDRDVWAIHNPKFWDAAIWADGIDEMATHYIEMMVEAGIRGRILLGGWSMGGYLSLAIAHAVANNSNSEFCVGGILMMDSPYHIARSQMKAKTSKPRLEGIPELVRKSFDNCDLMLQQWHLPQWDGPALEGQEVSCFVGGRRWTLPLGRVLYRPTDGNWRRINMEAQKAEGLVKGRKRPPPAVLIRCTRPADVVGVEAKPCLIDIFRQDRLLGWEEGYPQFIKAVLDMDDTHYSLFDKHDFRKMGRLTKRLKEALEILDSLDKLTMPAQIMDFF